MSRLSATLSRSVLKLLALLPLPFVRLLARFIARIMRVFPSKLHRITAINIELTRPELNDSDKRELVHQSIKSSLMTAMEMPVVWQRSNDWLYKHIIEINNANLMEELVAKNKGVIVICPHVGNWEVLGRKMPDFGPTTCLYQPPKYTALEDIVREGREKSGTTVVPTNQRGLAKLLKALKNGEITGILPDQVPKNESSLFAPFFGQQAYTMTLIHNLIQKTGCQVILGYAIRYKKGFKILFKPADELIYSEDADQSLAAMNRMVEQTTEEDFSQYQWTYKRFKRQADGSNPYRRSR